MWNIVKVFLHFGLYVISVTNSEPQSDIYIQCYLVQSHIYVCLSCSIRYLCMFILFNQIFMYVYLVQSDIYVCLSCYKGGVTSLVTSLFYRICVTYLHFRLTGCQEVMIHFKELYSADLSEVNCHQEFTLLGHHVVQSLNVKLFEFPVFF